MYSINECEHHRFFQKNIFPLKLMMFEGQKRIPIKHSNKKIMKTTSSTSIALTILFGTAIFFLESCKSSDVLPANIDPVSQPTEFTEALNLNGKIMKGTMPAGKPDITFRIEKSQASASVTNDNSLFIPFVYAIKPSQKLRGFYLQIKGSNVYWDIPYAPKNARVGAANENPEKNGFVLDVGIPKHILNGKFEVTYQIYDDKGNVSAPVIMKSELVSSIDYCANGGMTLGSVSGNDGITVRSYELGDQPGWVTIKYNTYTVKDRIDIRYAGEWVRSTGTILTKNQTPPIGQCNTVTAAQGFVGKAGEFTIYYDPQKDKKIDIYVSGCLDGGTQWIFEITDCPSKRSYLGIHSSEPANNCSNDCNKYGHAWISLTDNGKTTYYGLWPDRHLKIKDVGLDNGPGSDIRIGIESGFGEHSRYYLITNSQKEKFEKILQRNIKYSLLSYNCASFASDVIFEVVGERVNPKGPIEYAFRPMPCALSESIRVLNQTQPTEANYTPIGIKFTNFSRSFCE
jgi:hypothetical protein